MSNIVTGEWIGSVFTQVLQGYAKKLGTEIHVVNNEGELLLPKANKRLTICFYGSPMLGSFSGGAEERIKEVYGLSLKFDQISALAPSLVGLKIVDPDGITVAEVVENTLYILFNLLGESYTDLGEILDRIMADYIKLPASLGERREIVSRRMEELRSSSEVNFKNLFSQTLYKDSEIEKQFGVLKRMSKDGDLIVANGEIRVPLGRIIMLRGWFDKPEKKLDLGKILFVLGRIQTEDPTVKIFCLTKDPDYKNTYIGDMGYVCLGNISYGVMKLITDYEYALAAEAVKLFIEEEN